MAVALIRAEQEATHVGVGCYTAHFPFAVIIGTFLATTGAQQETAGHDKNASLGAAEQPDGLPH